VRATILFGPEYPPPGGVNFSSSGAGSGQTGGKTFSYSGFDPSQYETLYWGPLDVANVINAGDATPADMQFVGLAGGSYEFDSTANWTFNGAFIGTQHLPTRMLLTVTGLGAEDTQANLGASSPNGSYPLFIVTGNFSANFVFQVDYQNTWTPVDVFQNANNNNGQQNVKSVTFDFFNTTAPEPGSFLLLGTGFALAGLLRFRKRKSLGEMDHGKRGR
jgi:hypothetical protein